MDVTSSPVNKQAQSRAARTSSNQKSNRETLVQKDKPAPRSKENPATARNEPSQGPCKTSSSPTVPSPPGLKFALRSAARSTGSGGNPTPMNLNDPSIIFAQPAGRQGHWRNHMAQPGSLMGNGTMGKSESGHQAQPSNMSQGSRLWDHNKAPQYTLPPSWPYGMPQNFIQPGNAGFQPGKPFIAQGSVVHPNPNFPLVPHVRHQVNLNFIQQKK